jgi:hypothetical protein
MNEIFFQYFITRFDFQYFQQRFGGYITDKKYFSMQYINEVFGIRPMIFKTHTLSGSEDDFVDLNEFYGLERD